MVCLDLFHPVKGVTTSSQQETWGDDEPMWPKNTLSVGVHKE